MSEPALKAVPPSEPPASTAPHVLTAIAGVMEALSKEGISKDRSNTQQGYKFRGIDDVYNALAPVLAANKLVITPRCLERNKEVVTNAKGTTLFYVTVQVEFELASAIDGSSKTAVMFGEAMDSGDKATNKAMSAAYKYMAMQEFCIPTEGDNDADETTHQLGDRPRDPPPQSMAVTVAKTAIDMCRDRADLRKWRADNEAALEQYDAADRDAVVAHYTLRWNNFPPTPKQAAKPAPAQTMPLDDEIPF